MKVNFHLDKQQKPQSESGMKVVYGQAKRGGYRLRWYLILMIVISPLLFMVYYLFRTHVFVTAPAIVTSYPLTVTATQSAVVGPIPVEVGGDVERGQSLLLLGSKALEEEVTFIQRELLKLSDDQVKNTDALYLDAIANTQETLEKVEQIQSNYDEFRKKGQVSEVDYASVVSVSNALNSQLSNQKIAYADESRHIQEQKLAGPVSQEYRALMRELVVKRAQQESLTLRAPFEGRVLDIYVHEGQRVTENTPLLTVARNITPEITAFLNPKYLEYTRFNTKAKVVFPDGKKFATTVTRPVEVVNKLPQELQSPFEGQPAYLKVTLSFDEPLHKSQWIEGVEVEVRF
ncbi:HlyD family secretion protein [Photobacterium sanctipauli]|uniref:HlyD family secretion protein n=1 Tax=Photobacterium sanctipauli TaxID=1342794 RepID=A0A2T3NPN5_9GAMM|nr:HlyD family efflux transporter periplasmic adaptor subunit [Photobacterium sanctipauli]PSW18211.1 HlyD family secretion protein [Photobacterium sanctipauli]